MRLVIGKFSAGSACVIIQQTREKNVVTNKECFVFVELASKSVFAVTKKFGGGSSMNGWWVLGKGRKEEFNKIISVLRMDEIRPRNLAGKSGFDVTNSIPTLPFIRGLDNIEGSHKLLPHFILPQGIAYCLRRNTTNLPCIMLQVQNETFHQGKRPINGSSKPLALALQINSHCNGALIVSHGATARFAELSLSECLFHSKQSELALFSRCQWSTCVQ